MSQKQKVLYTNPVYEEISKHNFELIPKLKPSWKALKDGDLKTFNEIATEKEKDMVSSEFGKKKVLEFINYIEDEQESVARAFAANISDHVGSPQSWNLEQLKDFLTPESIDKLRKGVWSLFGVTAGYGTIKRAFAGPGIHFNDY